MLSDPAASVVVVEYRDRVARFGAGRLEAVLGAHGRQIVVADPGETEDDLVWDVIEALALMCARRYGGRGARHRAMGAVAAAKQEPGEAAL